MKPPRAKPTAAFTLVELLISMAILSLVVAAIYSSWTAILRASKVGLDAAAAAQRSRIALHTLEDSLTAAELFARNYDYYGFVAENGDKPLLSFVARLPKSFPRSGRFGAFDVRRLIFTVERGDSGSDELVLRQQPLIMELDKDEKEHPLVLARDVKEFALEFWEPRLNDWTDEWRTTNQLPKLVKVTLKVQHQDPRHFGTVEEVTRVVALTSAGVPPQFQTPSMPAGGPMGFPGGPGGPGGPGRPFVPGQPGGPGQPFIPRAPKP